MRKILFALIMMFMLGNVVYAEENNPQPVIQQPVQKPNDTVIDIILPTETKTFCSIQDKNCHK